MTHGQAKDIMIQRGLRFAAPNEKGMLFPFMDADGELVVWEVVEVQPTPTAPIAPEVGMLMSEKDWSVIARPVARACQIGWHWAKGSIDEMRRDWGDTRALARCFEVIARG